LSPHIIVLLDTKGPEIRTGFFKEGIEKIELQKGNELILTGDYTYKGDSNKLACSYETIASSVHPGKQILVADGSLVLTVLACDEIHREVTCRIENNALLGERKNMVRLFFWLLKKRTTLRQSAMEKDFFFSEDGWIHGYVLSPF